MQNKTKWPTKKLIEFCDFERGTEPGSKTYNREGLGVSFIRVGNVAAKIQEQIYTTSRNIKLCDENDILLTLDGSPGVIVKGFKGAYSSGIRKVIIKKPNKLLKDFIYFILQADFIQRVIEKYTTGMTIKHASKSLQYIKIPLPSLPEQKKIVYVLDSVKSAVEVQDKIIEKTKELKRSLMEKLFREGTRGAKLKKTEIGEIPENWEVVRLGEVTEATSNINPKEKPNKKIKYIDVSSISSEFLKIIEFKEYYGKNTPSRARKKIKTGDILFATVRPYLKRIAIVSNELDEEICSTAFCVIKCKDNLMDRSFLFNYISTNSFIDRVTSLQTGANYPAVSDKDLFIQKISLPPFSEQREIAEILQTVDQKIEIEKKKKELYEELFKTMLNKLMAGEIRVNNIKF